MITTLIDVNLRSAATRRGLILTKNRSRMYARGLGNGYMIRDAYTGNIVAGHKYELTPEEVRDYLNEH